MELITPEIIAWYADVVGLSTRDAELEMARMGEAQQVCMLIAYNEYLELGQK